MSSEIYSVENEKEPLVVGQEYVVKCIQYNSWKSKRSIEVPVFGKPHSDSKEVGGDQGLYVHIHLDVRFLSEDFIQKEGITIDTQIAAIVGDGYILKMPSDIELNYTYKILKCLRQWKLNLNVKKRVEFENKFKNSKMKCNICPHQKTDLSTIESIDFNGVKVKVCPLHRLIWNEKTGDFVENILSQ